MRWRRLCLPAAGVLGTCAVLVVLLAGTPAIAPLSVSIESAIPAGVDDDHGQEMRLLTLLIQNTNSPATGPDHNLYEIVVQQRDAVIEAKVKDQWLPVTGKLDCRVQPRHASQKLLLVPEETEAVRASLRCAPRVPSVRWRLMWNLARLERLAGRSLAPSAFYKWVYRQPTLTGDRWTEFQLQLTVPDSTHNHDLHAGSRSKSPAESAEFSPRRLLESEASPSHLKEGGP